MKLELKHLAPYLDKRLMIITDNDPYNVPQELTPKTLHFHYGKKGELNIKPILRPLSDFEKEITEVGSVMFLIEEQVGYKFNISQNFDDELLFTPRKMDVAMFFEKDFLGIYDKLLKHHFDVFGLIDKGLAIDINTLDK